MSKMAKRRRTAKKNKKTMSKLLKSLKKAKTKVRCPVPPVGGAMKTKKDYNRQDSKKVIKKALLDE